MKVELISIGDELLIGQTVNTNASWMGEQLSKIGARIAYGTVIRDTEQDIYEAFDRAMNRVDVVVVTGGLGPTKDDITKQVICDFFNTKLVRNEAVLAKVKGFFERRKLPFLDVNYFQADLPEIAIGLENDNGTAPGIWIERNGRVFVSMPGVPYEMKGIMLKEVLPRLQEMFKVKALYYRTIQTQGIGETYIAERIKDIEDDLRANDVELAYLPSPGSVRLRLSGEDNTINRDRISKYLLEIEARIPQYAFGREKDSLEKVVGELLLDRDLSIGTVESCTAGTLASAIVSVPGASRYFMGSIVSYSNEIKSDVVGVSAKSLEEFGAVSEEVVSEMAVGGRQLMGTDYCIATSGIAGPDGGTEEKPVGTVWIAIAGPKGVMAKQFLFEKDRQRNIQRSVLTALNLLRCELKEINIEKS